MDKTFDIIVAPSSARTRLDVFLSKETGITRSQIDKLIRSGSVKINGRDVKQSLRVKADDRIKIIIPEAESISAVPQKISLDIVYEDKDVIVINKPAGIVVHPAAGNPDGTLVNALLFHCKDLSSIGGCVRPGVVHRLDKDTSGLIMFAKNDAAHLELSRQLKDRKVRKIYVALVRGEVRGTSGVIDAPLGRNPVNRKKMAVITSDKLKKREAVTHYKVVQRFKGYTLLELDLKTGRTHQIRVHLAHIGHPIVGDATYSRKSDPLANRQLLHAQILGFYHPVTGRYMEFKAEMPEDIKEAVGRLVQNEPGDDAKKK
jgi:23S rRNA pseudouridine1911/1915/1917 synthase